MIKIVRIRPIPSLDFAELRPYRTLKRPLEHARLGIFVAEGERVVRRLLDSGLEVLSLLLTPDWLERLELSGNLAGRANLAIFLAETDLLREVVGFNIHQGVMAVARVPAEGSISRLPEPHLLVALDGLRISENVGVIVRNCAAFGVDAILVGANSCSPYLRRAVRSSMGAVFKVPVIHLSSLPDTLSTLQRSSNTRIIAADPHGATTIHRLSFRGNVCIVLGNEEEGVSPEIAELATDKAAIPMRNQTDSLNVASASAVFLCEADRQRTAAGGGA